jgi:hypothetical protein
VWQAACYLATACPVLLLVATLLPACVATSVNYSPLNPSPHALAPRPVSSVEVFASGPPDRPHVDVGMITVEEGDVGESSPQELLALLRQNAANQGCDALVVSPPSSRSDADFLAYTHSRRVFSGTCVVYRTPDAAALAGSPPRP